MSCEVRRIGLIVYDGVDLLDVAGPGEVFNFAARHLIRTGASTEPMYRLDALSIGGGQIRTDLGFGLASQPLGDVAVGEYDTIIVAGGHFDVLSYDPALVSWLRRNHPAIRRIGSVCTGAFILGHAGLLNGRTATTHWMDCDALRAAFPDVNVQDDSIFVEDGGIWTAAGITSGIDMALAMVEQDYGRELALTIARKLIVFMKRPGGQSQFSTTLRTQAVEGPLVPILRWIVDNPDADLSAEALAQRANMSLRNFFRTFQEATGMAPAQWVSTVRMEVAKRLLEQTAEHVDQVARKAGFLSYERMRRTFARQMGVTPAAYRARFASPRGGERSDVNLKLHIASRRSSGSTSHR